MEFRISDFGISFAMFTKAVNHNNESGVNKTWIIPPLELTFEQFHGQRIQQLLLHGAFEGARAELRIAAFLRQQLFRGGVHVQPEILLCKPFFQSPEKY